MALAQIEEITTRDLVARSASLGRYLREELSRLQPRLSLVLESRGVGLMVGLELRLVDGAPATAATQRIVEKMSRRGFILLPDGDYANVIIFTPPLTIAKPQLELALGALAEVIAAEDN